MENLEHEQDLDQEYMDAYNTGYLIGKYSPEIGELLVQAKGKGLKLEAYKDGMEQSLYEKSKEKTIEQDKQSNSPDWLSDDRLENLDREIDKNKDKDIEPEL